MHGMSSEGQFLACAEMQLRLEALASLPFKKKKKKLSPLLHSLLMVIAEGEKNGCARVCDFSTQPSRRGKQFLPARSYSNEELISTAQ